MDMIGENGRRIKLPEEWLRKINSDVDISEWEGEEVELGYVNDYTYMIFFADDCPAPSKRILGSRMRMSDNGEISLHWPLSSLQDQNKYIFFEDENESLYIHFLKF